jgi:hypothetical protein
LSCSSLFHNTNSKFALNKDNKRTIISTEAADSLIVRGAAEKPASLPKPSPSRCLPFVCHPLRICGYRGRIAQPAKILGCPIFATVSSSLSRGGTVGIRATREPLSHPNFIAKNTPKNTVKPLIF